jgi:hypothetical protein
MNKQMNRIMTAIFETLWAQAELDEQTASLKK